MRDAPAARAHALDREGQETVGTRAAPLRVTGWKVHADVAVRERPQYGINQCVQHNIGIGMAVEPARVRDAHAAEHHMVAGAE